MRTEVLQCYRKLFRTCQRVFHGDYATLYAAKRKLKEEFLKHSDVTDEVRLGQLVQEALEAEQFLREKVVQAVSTGDKVFRVKFDKDKVLADNLKTPKTEDKG